jgi:anti-sigma B factor antagonist
MDATRAMWTGRDSCATFDILRPGQQFPENPMPLHVRFDENIAILSNIGQLLNDPRHFDATREVREILERGYRKFIIELSGVREMASAGLGLLTTLTRLVRQYDGELVLANLSGSLNEFMEEMRMDAFWEVFTRVEDAMIFFRHEGQSSENSEP